MMRRRDPLPGDIEGRYIHNKTDCSDNTKVAQFFNHFVTTKNTKKVVEKRTGDYGEESEQVISKAFKCVHVSFQSTYPCNSRTVNALNDCKASDMIRARGQFDKRRYFGIEMNEAHQFYLGIYSRIDSIDHLIKCFA